MGYWGHELMDNDSTLDFLGELGDKLTKRLEADHPSTADFYNAAIVLRGVMSASEVKVAASSTAIPVSYYGVLDGLADAFIRNYYKAVSDSKDYEEFLEVLDRELRLIRASVKSA